MRAINGSLSRISYPGLNLDWRPGGENESNSTLGAKYSVIRNSTDLKGHTSTLKQDISIQVVKAKANFRRALSLP